MQLRGVGGWGGAEGLSPDEALVALAERSGCQGSVSGALSGSVCNIVNEPPACPHVQQFLLLLGQ